MFNSSLQIIKSRHKQIPVGWRDREKYRFYNQYLKGENSSGLVDRMIPDMPSDVKDYTERCDFTHAIYAQIQCTDDIGQIIKLLSELCTHLEIVASRKKGVFGPIKGPDGKMHLAWIGFDPSLNPYFEERVLTPARQSIIDLERLRQYQPARVSESTEQSDLHEREDVLIHCYKGLPPITREDGAKRYQHYLHFARTTDRLMYAGQSPRKCSLLIKSIEKVMPYLNEQERQMADKEIDTMRNYHSNDISQFS